jgi:hypothetical protein
MTVAIVATEQDIWPTRILVTVTGLAISDVVTVYRWVGLNSTILRGANSITVTDTSFLVVDSEVPYGVSVYYDVFVNATTHYLSTPASYTLDGGKVALTDGIQGLSAETVIVAWPRKERTRQSSVFNVNGRNVVVNSGQVPKAVSEITLFTETESARLQMTSILEDATSGILQIRQNGQYPGIDGYFAVTTFSEERFSQDGTDPRRMWNLQIVELTTGWPSTLLASSYTLQSIADAYTGLTLNDISNDYATLLLLAQGDF